REDCGGRGATLLEPWDRDELEFLNETLQRSRRNFWIGLWVPAAGTGWTWLNGSHLDRNRFLMDIGGKPGDCGMLSGRSINPQNCSSELHWLCQREVTEL
ncbi:KRBBB protein, partial [Orthonyx spaldingii]|nr:KRBBB protein [Orthonyx spaldingii]